ncbi:GNAT family N-acetyltransferase [Filimonas lacunae]|nr:GNAT family N-acetyltransferase [Filimonas lacunae]BAV05581.1 50S ribosomal protein acetyltransferase [Filimonas lacunae]
MLRQLHTDDLPALLKYVNNPHITDNIVNFPYPYLEYHAVHRLSYVYQGFVKKSHYVFAMIFRDAEPEELVGEVSLHLNGTGSVAEIGYWIGEPFWGQGITTEAVEAVIRFGFEKLALASIFAECHVDNKGSERVLVRNHMVKQEDKNSVAKYIIHNPAKA